jgi:hypothetical protein
MRYGLIVRGGRPECCDLGRFFAYQTLWFENRLPSNTPPTQSGSVEDAEVP